MTEIQISTEMITLGQFLKLADVIQSGGMAKWFLSEYEVKVNGELEDRRGRKLKVQDVIEIDGHGKYVVVSG
ncbi:MULTISPECIES: S4 domain-containing protein YaaA [unclassified Bacillus (in: firmicutes)]|jgi:S4 domain protein YaaA|uniref:S4 domain-containing protein YaaA n=1 Tax=unclassified Bacillus (in: firmicutes) TaxID=185979 RepID=UPI00145637BA|nr:MULTISPECIES: S4 domain-containing protein YaaA [unclassified Bacillus (in: firmicutes)]MEA3321546.1 S4 domain-containing protein YaaA [Bacillota bacterium]NLP50359.1 S4 domain-containing protein YaaA [Bacillus sp. RO1]NMH72572.1 S4 domain-containing protein YaaA [Bacillus sp. RO2]